MATKKVKKDIIRGSISICNVKCKYIYSEGILRLVFFDENGCGIPRGDSVPMTGVKAVYAGDHHLVVRTKDGVYTLGENFMGQLGYDTPRNRPTFVLKKVLDGGNIKDVRVGFYVTEIKTDEGIFVFGPIFPSPMIPVDFRKNSCVAMPQPVQKEIDVRIEEPKAEEPKAEESKAEEPKVEEPKVEEPKVEEQKTGKVFYLIRNVIEKIKRFAAM